MLESVIQRKIIILLEAAGWYVIKLIQTNKNGIPDLVALKDRRTIFIEVKSEKGKQSDLQRYRQVELERQGFTVLIVKTTKEVDEFIKSSTGI